MHWVVDVIWPYVKILALLLGGCFGLPIPEDIALVWAGILVHDEANIFVMAIVCYFGILLGDILIFRAGRLAGPSLLKKRWIRSRIGSEKLQTLRAKLDSRAFVTVLIARHLFYLRTATFLVCGAVRMRFWRFLVADAIAALLTVPLMMGLGYLFAEHQDVLFTALGKVKLILVGFGIAALLLIVLYRIKKRKSEALETSDEEVDEGEVTSQKAKSIGLGAPALQEVKPPRSRE